MADTRTITVTATRTDPIISIHGLTAGPERGWNWTPHTRTLTHPAARGGLKLNDHATNQIVTAIRTATLGSVDRKGGLELSRMTETERAQYEWDGSEDSGQPYIKVIPGVPATFELSLADVEMVR